MNESKKNQSKEGRKQSYNANPPCCRKVFFWIALETIDFPIISTTTAVGRTGSTVMNESCETRLVAPIIRTRYIFFGSRSISSTTAMLQGVQAMNETGNPPCRSYLVVQDIYFLDRARNRLLYS